MSEFHAVSTEELNQVEGGAGPGVVVAGVVTTSGAALAVGAYVIYKLWKLF